MMNVNGNNHGIIVEQNDKVLIVRFNRPDKRNCLNRWSYIEICRILRDVNQNDSVTLVVFTGVGDYFTAGNDFTQSTEAINDFDAYVKESGQIFKDMLLAFIKCNKIIVFLINGPCIGVGTTLAALADLVWCSETAYFATPFIRLGIVPEGGSTYVFPKLMGRSKATELLLFGERLTAKDAVQYKLASRIFQPNELKTTIWPKIYQFSKLSPQALQISKKLILANEMDALIKTIDAECIELYKRLHSEEFLRNVLKFAMKKSKL